MTNAISTATKASPPIQPPTATPTKPKETKQEVIASQAPAASHGTVTISDAAKAALQEATESTAQTIKEAAANDPQARRLMAKMADYQKQ